MLWLQPAAWVGLVAIAAPVLIHLLVHRRSDPLAFPTLRFLRPTRFASLRRHALADLALLAVRIGIILAAVGALAAPLLTTASRRAAWNSRLARAIVVDTAEPGREERAALARRQAADAFRSTIIATADVADGMHRAAAWLGDVTLARREIVCVSPLAIGSVTAADVAAVPSDIGLQFIQQGALPPSRTLSAADVLTGAAVRGESASPGAQLPAAILHRTTTLTAARTAIADAGLNRTVLPLEILSAPDDRSIVDAALTAVLRERTWAPASNRSAQLMIAGAPDETTIRAATEVHTAWIGDAIARVAADAAVTSAASEVESPAPLRGRTAGGTTGSSARETPGVWHAIAAGADGSAIVTAAQSGNRLLVASAAPAAHVLTPVLIRSVLNALSAPPDFRGAEIVPIAAAQLDAWQRPPGFAPTPTPHHPLDDVNGDRRWLWGAVLCLIAIEEWIRRRSDAAAGSGVLTAEEIDRVA